MQAAVAVAATWLAAVLLREARVAEEQVALMIAAPQVTVQQEQTTLVVGVEALAV